VIHRDTRVEDDHAGKSNGLGGKLEANEPTGTLLQACAVKFVRRRASNVF